MLTDTRTVPSEKLWDVAKQYILAILDTQKWIKEYLQRSTQPLIHWESYNACVELETEYNQVLTICCQHRGFEVIDIVRPMFLVQWEHAEKPTAMPPELSTGVASSKWAALTVDKDQTLCVELFPSEFQVTPEGLSFRHSYNLNWLTHTNLSLPLTLTSHITLPKDRDTVMTCVQFFSCLELADPESFVRHVLKYGITIPKYPPRQIREFQELVVEALSILNLILAADDQIYRVFMDEKPHYPSRLSPKLMFFSEWTSYTAYTQALVDFLIKNVWSKRNISILTPREGSNGD